MTDLHPRRPKIRWWHLAIATVALVIAAIITSAYAWRAVGRGQYLTVVEHLRAAGRPASVDDFVALAPPTERAVQDAWDVWQKRRIASPASGYSDFHAVIGKDQKAWDAWVGGRGPRPAEIEMIIAKSAPEFSEALVVLRDDRLVLSGFGWMAQDLPPEKRRLPFTAAIRLPNLLTIRELAVWLHHATVLTEDPRQHLADLDALVAAMGQPAVLIDAMNAIAIANIRDRTYVELALLGRLPDDARTRWLAEPPNSLRLVGDAFDGESALFSGHAMVAMLDHAGTPIPFVMENENWSSTWGSAATWVTGYQDCAVMIEIESHVAQRLRGERTDVWPTWDQIKPRLSRVGQIAVPNLFESTIAAVEADAGHRMARLAAQVIRIAHSGALPADQAALLTALGNPQPLTPTGDHLHLRYELPAPGRFRLVIDPASPVPNFDDPTRMPHRSKAAGTPPAKEPFVWNRTTTIEIQMPPLP